SDILSISEAQLRDGCIGKLSVRATKPQLVTIPSKQNGLNMIATTSVGPVTQNSSCPRLNCGLVRSHRHHPNRCPRDQKSEHTIPTCKLDEIPESGSISLRSFR